MQQHILHPPGIDATAVPNSAVQLIAGEQVIPVLPQIHVRDKVVALCGYLLHDPVLNGPAGNVRNGQNSGDVSTVRGGHQGHIDQDIPARLLLGRTHKAFQAPLHIPSLKRLQRRFVQINVQEFPPFLLVHHQTAQTGEKVLPHRPEGSQQIGIRIIDNLQNLVLGDIAVAQHQGVRPLSLVVLHDQILVLLPQPALLLALPCHVAVHGINPCLARLALNQGKGVFHPHVTSAALSQPVDDLAVVLVPGDVFRHLPVDIPAVLRMHALHGIPPVQLPGLVHGHLRHGGKALGHELRLHFPLRIAPNHRNSAGQIFQDRLKILRQPLLLPAQLNRPGHIPDDLHIGGDPVPVRLPEGRAVKTPGLRHNHLVLLPVRLPRPQRTIFTGVILPVQGLVTFLPHPFPPLRKEPFRLIDVKQVIIFFLNHIDPVRQVA